MRPSTVLLLASALPLICGTAAGHENSTDERASRSLIMVEGAQAADSDDLDPDDVRASCFRRRVFFSRHFTHALPATTRLRATTAINADLTCELTEFSPRVRFSRFSRFSRSLGCLVRQFLWETLPGRCCFYGGPDPLDPSKWLGAHTCDECTVWDLPNNFCHSSASACAECGMTLYCGRTPPLIAGNKVCTGASRVGHGCEDSLGTGVCATHSLAECQVCVQAMEEGVGRTSL